MDAIGYHEPRISKERLQGLLNPNPVVHEAAQHSRPKRNERTADGDESGVDAFDELEVYGSKPSLLRFCLCFSLNFELRLPDLIRSINDPEYPLTLEQLRVVTVDSVFVDNEHNQVRVLFTPTIPHCSMATLIGLSIRVKLLRALPRRFKVCHQFAFCPFPSVSHAAPHMFVFGKVDIRITPGTHASEVAGAIFLLFRPHAFSRDSARMCFDFQ